MSWSGYVSCTELVLDAGWANEDRRYPSNGGARGFLRSAKTHPAVIGTSAPRQHAHEAPSEPARNSRRYANNDPHQHSTRSLAMTTTKTCDRCGKIQCNDPTHRLARAAAPIPTLDGVADLVRSMVSKDVDAARARGSAIVDAANEYVRASAANAVGVFMARNGLLERAPDDHLDAALGLLDLVQALPEVKGARTTVEAPPPSHRDAATDAADEELTKQGLQAFGVDPEDIAIPPADLDVVRYAALRDRLDARRPAVLFGGRVMPNKLAWIRTLLGHVEWEESRPGDTRNVDPFCRRVRNGSVGFVLVLEGVLAHKISNPVIDAATQSRTPYAKVGTAGQAQVKRGLDELLVRVGKAA